MADLSAAILNAAQAAVFGVGAYIVSYLLMNEITSFLPAMLVAAVFCVVLNVLVTLPALRVSGDYFVVTSFGIQLLATAVFTNWTGGTGGANAAPDLSRALAPLGTQKSRCRPITWSMRTTPATRM